MKALAIYPGSFDPITNGHMDIIERSSKLFESVIVLVAHSGQKNSSLFTVQERVDMLKLILKDYKNISIDAHDGLLMDYAKNKKATALLRGLRAVSDFEYEFQMAIMNRHMHPDIEILFMMTGEKYFFLSSSMVKEVARLGGDITTLVPPLINQMLKHKL